MTSTNGDTPKWRVPLSDLMIDEQILEAAYDAVASGWWSMGERVAELERRFAEHCGTRHAIAVANGTAALHLALLATGCGAGDDVVVPSLTFVAAANTVVHTGATPIFCDIRGDDDLTLDPADVEAALSASTKAVVVMHYGGFPCNMDAIAEVARRFGIAVVEDAAHAPGAAFHGRRCGSLGDVGCFSFFSNKNLPTGEGGMVVTDDDEIAREVRAWRSHGMTSLTWDRHHGHASSYDVIAAGFNYRLDELRAALGLVQLERLDAGNAARARAVAMYRDRLSGVDGLDIPFSRRQDDEIPAHHLFVVLLPQGVSREGVRESLRTQGIQTSVHYPPIHRFAAYADQRDRRALPRTEAIAPRLLTLPLFPHISEEQVSLVCESLLAALSLWSERGQRQTTGA